MVLFSRGMSSSKKYAWCEINFSMRLTISFSWESLDSESRRGVPNSSISFLLKTTPGAIWLKNLRIPSIHIIALTDGQLITKINAIAVTISEANLCLLMKMVNSWPILTIMDQYHLFFHYFKYPVQILKLHSWNHNIRNYGSAVLLICVFFNYIIWRL